MKRTWMAPVLALLVCGGVGWIAGRSGSCPSCLSQLFTAIRGPRPAPVASIPEQTPGDAAVSDDEARLRVEQLIGHKLLDEIPQVAGPFTRDEPHANEPPLAKTIMPQADDAAPTVIPPATNPGLNISDRFDLWLLLCVPSPLIVDDVEADEELGDFFKVESETMPSLALRAPAKERRGNGMIRPAMSGESSITSRGVIPCPLPESNVRRTQPLIRWNSVRATPKQPTPMPFGSGPGRRPNGASFGSR